MTYTIFFGHSVPINGDKKKRFFCMETPSVFWSLKQTLEDHAVLPERVVYIGADTKETRCFVSEGPDLVRLFFRLYDSLQDAIVFSDGGN